MSTGTSSPYVYSQSDSHSLSEGNSSLELSGWGNETMGHWESGGYRLEIWYDGKCVFVKKNLEYTVKDYRRKQWQMILL